MATLGNILGFGSNVVVTPGTGTTGSGSDTVITTPSGEAIDSNYANTLVGQGKITLTQKQQLLAGTLTPESLVAAGTITQADYAALTGNNYSSATGTIGAAVPWTSTLVSADQQLVTFNGALFQGIGQGKAGVIPPVEVATPATSGSPMYRLLCRGRSPGVTFDPTAQYYQDQVVYSLGGRYRAEAPAPAKGVAPCTDGTDWVAEFQGMTNAEQQVLTNSNISGVVANLAAVFLQRQSGDIARVKRFELQLTASGAVATSVLTGGLYTPVAVITFPVPLGANKTPDLRLTPELTPGATKPIAVQPVFNSLNQCTGLNILSGVALGAGDIINCRIEVDEFPRQ